MKITILTICPEQFNDFLNTPLISRNSEKGLLEIEICDIRDYAPGSFRKVDDSPYGGGAGMIMRCQPVLDALADKRTADSYVIVLSPQGRRYDQKEAHRLSQMKHLICGHYEGMDARIYDHVDELISIGDYILCGGEMPAMIITESVMRLVDGSMKKESVLEESFEEDLLEYPQYTRPADYKGQKVPVVLLSGDHEAIRNWRHEEAVKLTEKMRPDLLEKKRRKNVQTVKQNKTGAQ